MKKLILLSLISLFLFNCTPKKITPTARQGEYDTTYESAYDTANVGIIEVYREGDTIVFYRSVRTRQSTDKSKMISRPGAGTWSVVTAGKVYKFTKTPNVPVLVVPFKMNVAPNLMQGTENLCCCECPDKNKCCVTYGSDDYCWCDSCPENEGCKSPCYTTRYVANPYKGSVLYFYDPDFNGSNYKVIDL